MRNHRERVRPGQPANGSSSPKRITWDDLDVLWKSHRIGFNELAEAPGYENFEVVSEINEDDEYGSYGHEDYYDQEYYGEEYYDEEYGAEYGQEYDEEYGHEHYGDENGGEQASINGDLEISSEEEPQPN